MNGPKMSGVRSHVFISRTFLCALLVSGHTNAEVSVDGILDLRAYSANSTDSYVSGSEGKFRYSDGQGLALGQASADVAWRWHDYWHADISFYADADKDESQIGVLEAVIVYRGIPDKDGIRYSVQGGLFYPSISLENTLPGWASPYSLSFSAMNSWLAGEVRSQGVEIKREKLGRLSGSRTSYQLGVGVYRGNDTIGALLSWHGWQSTSRQTVFKETIRLPHTPPQPNDTDPFIEVDGRLGVHVFSDISHDKQHRLRVGYYDNLANSRKYIGKQWSWHTRFAHVAYRYVQPECIWLIQGMVGNTGFLSGAGQVVVDNDFATVNVTYSHRFQKWRATLRAEGFEVVDNDFHPSDINDEVGWGMMAGVQYQYSRQWTVHLEHQYLSTRRDVVSSDFRSESLTQLALRYRFHID